MVPPSPSQPGIASFTDVDVAGRVSPDAARGALRAAYLAAHCERAFPIAKTMQQWNAGKSSAHALGAIDLDSGFVGFKCWVNTPRGAQAELLLFDADQGTLRARFSAGELGMLRTAGTAALATDLLAAPGAAEMALLGTGRQALHQVVAVKAVRPLLAVRVWSPRAASREAMAKRIRDDVGLIATVHDDWQGAVDGAPIVTTVTRSAIPFLDAGPLATGTHLNAVGAILPSTAEILPSVVEASAIVVVDDLENARRASAELATLGPGLPGARSLGALLAGECARPEDPRLTLYKGLGGGIADVAIATAAYRDHTERH